MKKIFFILKVPPPVHGSTLMNKKVMMSAYLQKHFECFYFPLSISKDVSDIGKFSFRKFSKVVTSYYSLFKALRKCKPDLVYFALSPYGMAFLKDYLLFTVIRLFNLRIIFHLHGRGIREQGRKSKLFHKLYKILFRHNYVICLSPELTEDIELYTGNIFILPNGIEKNIQSNKIVRSDSFKITYLSNFIQAKGILDLIEALAIVKQRGNFFSVSLIGKDGDVSSSMLKNEITRLKLEGFVHHIGPLYDGDKYAELSGADLFVFPTRYKNEAFPLVILEAMQCGLPVISTREGGISSLVDDGETGYLINDTKSEELVDKIEYLIRNPTFSKQLGVSGKRKFDTHYTMEIFEHKLAEILQDVLNKQQV